MEQLIKIETREGAEVVSARDLYIFLGARRDFTNWCKSMFEYGFTEGVDYSLAKIGERSAHNKIDYALTIDCAKEISMLQRSEKGKQAKLPSKLLGAERNQLHHPLEFTCPRPLLFPPLCT